MNKYPENAMRKYQQKITDVSTPPSLQYLNLDMQGNIKWTAQNTLTKYKEIHEAMKKYTKKNYEEIPT